MTTTESPLQRVKPAELRPKYDTDWEQICSNEPFAPNAFHEFYCLSPKPALIFASLAALKDEELLEEPRKQNLHSLFLHGVEILANADKTDSRRAAVIQVCRALRCSSTARWLYVDAAPLPARCPWAKTSAKLLGRYHRALGRLYRSE
jgi:hypothetical protein